MRLGGEALHVVAAAGAVVDFGQRDHRDIIGDRRFDIFRLDKAQFEIAIEQADQALHHVKIGREIAGVGEDHAAFGPQAQSPRQAI